MKVSKKSCNLNFKNASQIGSKQVCGMRLSRPSQCGAPVLLFSNSYIHTIPDPISIIARDTLDSQIVLGVANVHVDAVLL